MSNKKRQQYEMTRVGTKEDYEQYIVAPCSVQDAVSDGSRSEVLTHYDKDSYYPDPRDVETKTISVGGQEYEYVVWGDDDMLPYHLQDKNHQNMVVSQCMAFNTQVCYGQGLQFVDRETDERATDARIRDFCLHNSLHMQFLAQALDMKQYYFSVLVINLSRDGSQIVRLRHRKACDCRFTLKNKKGRIEHVLIGDFSQSVPETVEVIPLLDDTDPLGDLMVRMGNEFDPDTGEKNKPTQDRKFAVRCYVPYMDNGYYPTPHYTSIYRDYWYDIYRLIGSGKRAMIKNTSAPRWQVEVHRNYWQNLCNEENITDPKKRKERIKQERDNITEFCTNPKNAGKTWVTTYDMSLEGKEVRMVRIYNLMAGGKKEGGDWSDDIQEASNSLCFAMGVHPNMVGAVPGKSQMNNSGSDKRELFDLKQSLEKVFHDIMEVPYHLMLHYNGLDERFTVRVPVINLVTLDKSESGTEESVNQTK